MDPVANLAEQREAARFLLTAPGYELFDEDASLEERAGQRRRAGARAGWSDEERREREGAAERLAELVLALDEWRKSGGFDPWDPTSAPTGDDGPLSVYCVLPGAAIPEVELAVFMDVDDADAVSELGAPHCRVQEQRILRGDRARTFIDDLRQAL